VARRHHRREHTRGFAIVRPTIIIAEPEPKDALSVRKLVIETAKFNVITAYSADEAMELLRLFPKVDGAVVVSELKSCEKVTEAAKAVNGSMPVIVLSASAHQRCGHADHNISSHEPEELLNLLRSLFGDPRELGGQRKTA
jgi:hypothetical protein